MTKPETSAEAPRRFLPDRSCNWVAAVAVPVLLLVGWWASGAILAWLTPGPVAFASATDLLVHRAFGALAFASPVIFGWITTGVYGLRSGSRGGLAAFGLFTGILFVVAVAAGSYRLVVLRALLPETAEEAARAIVMLRALNWATWSVVATVAVSVALRSIVALRYGRARPAGDG